MYYDNGEDTKYYNKLELKEYAQYDDGHSDYYNKKKNRHYQYVKGFISRSGRTIRPVGKACNWIDATKRTDDSRKHVNRFLRMRRVRKCDMCTTHVCETNIPVYGRHINIKEYMD